MKQKSGFSLLETIIVIAIIAVLAALLFPVFASARRSAKVVDTMSAAHQLWMALSLYRSDWGDAEVGTASQMGFPQFSMQMLSAAPESLWMRTCSPKEGFTYWPEDETGPKSWVEKVKVGGPSTPVVTTGTCTEDNWDVNNPYHPKLGIGVNLAGTVIKKRRAGDVDSLKWWLD